MCGMENDPDMISVHYLFEEHTIASKGAEVGGFNDFIKLHIT
jgi:hypothetical protein